MENQAWNFIFIPHPFWECCAARFKWRVKRIEHYKLQHILSYKRIWNQILFFDCIHYHELSVWRNDWVTKRLASGSRRHFPHILTTFFISKRSRRYTRRDKIACLYRMLASDISTISNISGMYVLFSDWSILGPVYTIPESLFCEWK